MGCASSMQLQHGYLLEFLLRNAEARNPQSLKSASKAGDKKVMHGAAWPWSDRHTWAPVAPQSLGRWRQSVLPSEELVQPHTLHSMSCLRNKTSFANKSTSAFLIKKCLHPTWFWPQPARARQDRVLILLPPGEPANMAQSVVYADLKFAASPPLAVPSCPAAPDEDDSPYENVLLGTVPAEPSPGRWPRRWCIPMGLRATSLLVLLVLLVLLMVSTVALGTCYWQVTRSLRDASREHAAEQGRLEQELSAREQRLEQARLELAWARAELGRAWRDGNSSRAALELQDMELGRARQELAELHKDMQRLQGQLSSSESTVASLRACVNTALCAGWCHVLDWEETQKSFRSF